jgi:hypothetical protein
MFLALPRTSEMVALGVLLVACTDGIGTQIYPFGSVDPDAYILQAVKHSLAPAELNCPLKLLTPYDSWRSGDPSNKEMITVEVCDRSKHFSIKLRSVNADSIMIVAKRLD